MLCYHFFGLFSGPAPGQRMITKESARLAVFVPQNIARFIIGIFPTRPLEEPINAKCLEILPQLFRAAALTLSGNTDGSQRPINPQEFPETLSELFVARSPVEIKSCDITLPRQIF